MGLSLCFGCFMCHGFKGKPKGKPFGHFEGPKSDSKTTCSTYQILMFAWGMIGSDVNP